MIDRLRLGPDTSFAGPAIVVQPDATTLVRPGWNAIVLATGTLRLEVA